MFEKIIQKAALIIIWAFNPLILPTMGFLLIMDSIPGVEFYSFKLKFFIIAIVFITSCLIPLLYYLLSKLNQKIFNEKSHSNSKILLYLFTGISIFLGSQFLARLPVTDIFRALLIGICLILLIIFLVSFKWNVSEHMSALGGLWGTMIALNFRLGIEITGMLIIMSIISGIVGSSQIYLEKRSLKQVYSGFALGAIGLFSFILFI